MPPADARTAPTADLRTLGDSEETLELRLPAEFVAMYADDLLDRIGDWGPSRTPAGSFQLVPVEVERDLPLIGRWINDPTVATFWDLAGTECVTEAHLRSQLDGDGRSVPCLGVLEGTPMSYWEIYRADLDPLALHYPARPHDTGVHLLLGGVADRGRGLGSILLRAVADLVLDHRPACARVVAEPDLRNTPPCRPFSPPDSGSPPSWICPRRGPHSWSGTEACAMRCSAVASPALITRLSVPPRRVVGL